MSISFSVMPRLAGASSIHTVFLLLDGPGTVAGCFPAAGLEGAPKEAGAEGAAAAGAAGAAWLGALAPSIWARMESASAAGRALMRCPSGVMRGGNVMEGARLEWSALLAGLLLVLAGVWGAGAALLAALDEAGAPAPLPTTTSRAPGFTTSPTLTCHSRRTSVTQVHHIM